MRLIFVPFLLLPALALAEPEALSNDEMATATGGEGLSMALEYALNADAAGTPRAGTTAQQRRFAFKHNQYWLVVHDVRGGLVFDELQWDLERFGDQPAIKLSSPGLVHLNQVQIDGIFLSPDSQQGADPVFGPNPSNATSPHQSVLGYYGSVDLRVRGSLFIFPATVSNTVYSSYRFDN